MSPFLIYLITRLNDISHLFLLIGYSCATILSIKFVFTWFHNNEYNSYAEPKPYIDKLYYILIGLSFSFLILSVLIPSKEDAILIYTIPKIMNNPKVNSLPPKLLQSLNDTIDSYDHYIKKKLDDPDEKK